MQAIIFLMLFKDTRRKEMDQIKENKMGTMPVGRLLFSMATPMIISMLVQALYNIVDSIFVARLSEDALNAVGLAFSAQNLMIGIATGTGVGINALLAKSLGEKKFEDANKIAANGVMLSLVGYVIALLFGLFGAEAYYRFQTDIPEIVDAGVAYLRIVTCYSFGLYFQITFERLMQSTGKTVFTMITQTVGAVINIILDPILIFTCNMGVAGAAYATVIGQIFAAVLGFFLNHFYNREIRMDLKNFRPDLKTISRIYAIGIPSIIMVAIGSVMYYIMSKILIGMNKTASAVFGVYFKLQSIVFMPIFGLSNGLIPILAYNYGAKSKKRMMHALKLSLLVAVIIMILGTLIMQVFPDPLLLLFDASENMLGIGRVALRIISISFIAASLGIMFSAVFQSLGNGIYSMIVSFARQLIVLVPVAYLLSLTGKLEIVWLAFPISETVSLIVSIILFIIIYKRKIKEIENMKIISDID